MIERELPQPLGAAIDFTQLQVNTPEGIDQLEAQLASIPGFEMLVDHYLAETEVSNEVSRKNKRFYNAMICEYEGSQQEHLLNKLFDQFGFDGTFEFIETTIKQDFPNYTRTAAIEHARGVKRGMADYFGDVLPEKVEDTECNKNQALIDIVVPILESALQHPDYKLHVVKLFSMADKITRQNNPNIHALLMSFSDSEMHANADDIRDFLYNPDENTISSLFIEKARTCFEAGESALSQLVSFMHKTTDLPQNDLFEKLLVVNYDEWPSFMQSPIKSKVDETLTKALSNFETIRQDGARPNNEQLLQSARESVKTIIYLSLEQQLRHATRNNVLNGGRKIARTIIPTRTRTLLAYLKGEDYRRKRETTLKEPHVIADTVEVEKVPESKRIVNTELQNSRLRTTEDTVEDKIHEFCKSFPNAEILIENITNMLKYISEADFSVMISGLKQLSSTKGGRVRDEEGKGVNLFELKPTEINAGVKINGQLLKQTRLVVSLNNDGTLGLVLIGKRDKISELLRNRGIT